MLRRFLAQQPVGWLVDELLESAGRDPLLRTRLLVGAGTPAETAFDGTLTQQALVNDFSVEGFVGYREAGDYFWGIGQALEEVEQLVDERCSASAARLALFPRDPVEEIHLRAIRSARADPGKLSATLVERAVASDYEVFYCAAGEYAEILGERGLAAYRDVVEKRWQQLPQQRRRHGVPQVARPRARRAQGPIHRRARPQTGLVGRRLRAAVGRRR